jgi:hypothetical protein
MTFVIGTPHTHNCGNLNMNTGGYKPQRIEQDIQCCTHCQKVIRMQEWRENGAFCSRCMAPVCADGECAKATQMWGCIPFMKKLERFFEREGKLAQYRKLAGLDRPPAPQASNVFGAHIGS